MTRLVQRFCDGVDTIAGLLLGVCTLLVVATAVGGIPDVVTDRFNARLVPSGDETALTRALAEVLGDPAASASLGRNGRDEVLTRYSLDRITGEYERRYRELIAARTGGR